MLNSKQVLFPLGDSYIKEMDKKTLDHTDSIVYFIAYNKFSSSKK